MRVASIAVSIVAVAAGLGVSQGARAAVTLAVYPLQPLGVPAATVDSLDATLRGEIARLHEFQLLDRGRTGAALRNGAASPGVSCNGTPACLSELGRLLSVQKVIYGIVSGIGDSYSIELKLIDVASGGEERRVRAAVGGKREALLAGLRGTVVRLLEPARWVGALEVHAGAPGSLVVVDGRPVGQTPLGHPVARLTPGRHSLRIAKSGFAPFEKFVDVHFGETTVVQVDLAGSTVRGVMYREGAEAPAPAEGRRTGAVPVIVVTSEAPSAPRYHDWAWRAVDASLGLAALGLGAGLISQVNRSAASSMTRPVSAAQEFTLDQRLSRSSGFGLAADFLWIGAGASLITAGLLFAVGAKGDAGGGVSGLQFAPAPNGLVAVGQF